MLESGILNALKTDAAIGAIVKTRIRPLAVAQNDARPYLVYQVTSDESITSIGGEVDDYAKAEFEIGIYADTYDQVMTLSGLIRRRLDMFGQTIGGVEFAPAMYDSQSDVEQALEDGQELPVYVRVQTYRALYKII